MVVVINDVVGGVVVGGGRVGVVDVDGGAGGAGGAGGSATMSGASGAVVCIVVVNRECVMCRALLWIVL